MSLIRKNNKGLARLFNDDLAIWEDFFDIPLVSSYERRLYNPNTHDLIPKKSFIEQEIKNMENEIKILEERKKHLEKEIKELK